MKQIRMLAQYYVDLMMKLGLVRFSMLLALALVVLAIVVQMAVTMVLHGQVESIDVIRSIFFGLLITPWAVYFLSVVVEQLEESRQRLSKLVDKLEEMRERDLKLNVQLKDNIAQLNQEISDREKAEAERQKVLDAIKKLEDDREDVREDYRDLLTDFIGDATRKLAEIGGEIPTPSLPTSAHARVAETTVEATGRVMTSPAQAPINVDGTAAYAMPQTGAVSVAPATPTPSRVEKDLSGFGDADDAFEFEEID